MILNKLLERKLKFILNECLPPVLRDNRLMMRFLLNRALKKQGEIFLNFQETVTGLSDTELKHIYEKVMAMEGLSNTDLTEKVLQRIQAGTLGPAVLDVGCGQGVLAGKLSRNFKVAACDINIREQVKKRYKNVEFKAADIQKLPYEDNQFDTVICAHTLEHVLDFNRAVGELRRVASQRLIIILPKERPYRYNFNLHLHFFPYRHSVLLGLSLDRTDIRQKVEEIEGCWYIEEDRTVVI
tara:strand:- start:54 stop:773 length:720 start_codon:yes stop_codon:yes gene_type:complete